MIIVLWKLSGDGRIFREVEYRVFFPRPRCFKPKCFFFFVFQRFICRGCFFSWERFVRSDPCLFRLITKGRSVFRVNVRGARRRIIHFFRLSKGQSINHTNVRRNRFTSSPDVATFQGRHRVITLLRSRDCRSNANDMSLLLGFFVDNQFRNVPNFFPRRKVIKVLFCQVFRGICGYLLRVVCFYVYAFPVSSEWLRTASAINAFLVAVLHFPFYSQDIRSHKYF